MSEKYTELHNLVKAYQKGNQEAITKLLIKFNNLLQDVIHKYQKDVVPMARQDMYNHAVLTFLRLTLAYNPMQGVDFPGYIKKHFEHTFTDTLGEI